MRIPLLGYFDKKPMGVKLTALFISVILIPMVLLAYISSSLIDSLLLNVAKDRITTGLKAAWGEYYSRGEQMRYGMLQVASMDSVKEAVGRGDKDYLKTLMIRWKQMRPYVDVWAIVDHNGRVIARLNSDYSGDELTLNGVVRTAMTVEEPIISTEILTRDLLKKEGNILEGISAARPGSKASETSADGATPEDAVALVVVTPVFLEGQRVAGAIITGDVLNSDSYIPDAMAEKMEGVFTSISLKGTRVSTNLVDGHGKTLRLSPIDKGFYSSLESGVSMVREWEAGGLTYLSAFEPIRDNKGSVIGSLGVSISKEGLWRVQKENLSIISMITLLGLSVSLLAAALSTYRITRPLKDLKDKLNHFAGGDMHVRADADDRPGAKDEIRILARTFNSMMDEVSRREAEKEVYRREIENKNTALVDLNDELKVANEELEVAYEETQSQTEELHAINEELKLLNEDLDRKNTELKRANEIISKEEQELKKAKNKLRLIYDSIRDDILLVDRDLSILEANRHLSDSLGLEEKEIIGRNIYETLALAPGAVDCPLIKAMEESTPVECEISTPDDRILMWHVFPLPAQPEEPGGAVVYIRDITEHRLLMRQLIQSDKLSSLGELVSGVAHELNNPLTGIMCFSELLMGDGLPEDVNSKLKKINDASHRCKKIIENLLTFGRWHRPEKKYADINRIIKESVELRAYQLKVDNVDVDLKLDETIPFTMLDENQIEQVFLNLINNAHDAIVEGGEEGTITITSSHDKDRLKVVFEDTGVGMKEEVAGRIFDPFFTTKKVGEGTGLGLSISYGIINEHNGKIHANSRPGAGTTFVVHLPVVEMTAESGAGSTAPGWSERLAVSARGMNALVLDDEPIVLDLLNDTLKSTGFVVDMTSSAEDAIKMVMTKDYDIIISDIKMPGMDGKVFYRELRKVKPESADKTVFISGDSVNRDTLAFLEDTGSLYLKKPFSVDELKAVLSRVVS